MGCDTAISDVTSLLKFLLTHPVWDVTYLPFSYVLLKKFLLTHPVWDVTLMTLRFFLTWIISTHTSRVGCDSEDVILNTAEINFYSHIPCGMWPYSANFFILFHQFLLTHPVWDVTSYYLKLEYLLQISTHTSRVGCDGIDMINNSILYISTHTSRVGCDDVSDVFITFGFNFYSHIPCGMWLNP